MSARNNTIAASGSMIFGVRAAAVDFVLFSSAYFLINFFKRGTFALSPHYVDLLFLFYICWIAASVTGRKFEKENFLTLRSGFMCIGRSFLYMTYCIAFAVVFLGVSGFSRVQIFSTCLTLLALECVVWSMYWSGIKGGDSDLRMKAAAPAAEEKKQDSFSFPFLGVDFILILLAFFTANYLKRGHFYLPPNYGQLLMLLAGLWFVVSLAMGKFSGNANRGYYFSLVQWLKTGLILVAVISIVFFGLRLFHFSRFQTYGTIVFLMGYETAVLWLYYRWRKVKTAQVDIESVEEIKKELGQENIEERIDADNLRQQLMTPVREGLKQRLGEKDAEMFAFMDAHIELDNILCLETTAESSRKMFSLTCGQIPIRLLLNLRKVNDEQRINRYFLDVHQTLVPGGYFVCRAHTIVTHRDWIFSKYSRSIARFVYVADFLINRVCPKLPWIKKVYFAMTKGKNRLISKAEVLGRLSFCGFEIVAEKVIDRRVCVIARKVKKPAVDASPTYGPFVELKRVGYNNEVVKVYKLRTMHPYSEYLQDYVFKLEGLQKGGKLQNDFRRTEWGHLARKLWLDELPMLYNWLKGDLQLVGVRPLSLQYFSLYDKELQEMRGLVKPGLVPPFYVDMPETFEEIVESEKRYIRAFLKHPVRTQVYYFWKSFVNIVIKGARSK